MDEAQSSTGIVGTVVGTPIRLVLALLILGLPAASCSKNQAASPPASAENSLRIDTVINKVSITREEQILWNGQVVSEAQLASLLRATKQLKPEPELNFQPDVDTDYNQASRVLNLIKESGTTKFGFVGNEAYSEFDQPAE